jgi:hypothetical protein
MKAVAKEQLPTSLFFSLEISVAPFFQRALYPDNELISVSAVVIFFFVFCACDSNSFLISSCF